MTESLEMSLSLCPGNTESIKPSKVPFKKWTSDSTFGIQPLITLKHCHTHHFLQSWSCFEHYFWHPQQRGSRGGEGGQKGVVDYRLFWQSLGCWAALIQYSGPRLCKVWSWRNSKCSHTQTHTHTQTEILTYTETHIYRNTHTDTHTYTSTHTHTQMSTHTHTHKHTYTQFS